MDTAVVTGLRVTRDGKELYYTDYKAGTLFGVDTASGQKNFELALPSFAAFKVALSADGNTAYVTGAVRGKSVYGVRVVDLAGKKIATSIDTELSYGGSDIAETTSAVSKDGKTLVISEANDGGNKASVVDLAGGKVTATVELGSTPIGVAIAPDGKTAYVGGFEDEVVFVIDLGSNAVKGKIELKTTCGVYDLKISPDGKTLYAACQKGAGGVIKIAL
ncbi:YncE family protein [Candidatus Acetothermia bacterium]|nr:YncE family protein [Candidatus Acetothermia bacterium]